MKLEDQVCTIQQSEQLRTLGVSDSSLFEYCERMGEKVYVRMRPQIDTDDFKLTSPAYTVAELGVMLDRYTYYVSKKYKWWRCELEHGTTDPIRKNYGTGTTHYSTDHQNEAQARAAMLIYLIENNLLTPDEVNARL